MQYQKIIFYQNWSCFISLCKCLHVQYKKKTFYQKWSCFKFLCKHKIFLTPVYMIFKYGKRFRFAPSFNQIKFMETQQFLCFFTLQSNLCIKKFGLTLLSSQFLSPDMPKKMTFNHGYSLIVFMHFFPSPNLPFPIKKIQHLGNYFL